MEGVGSWREERREEQEGRREKQKTIGQVHANLHEREKERVLKEGKEEGERCILAICMMDKMVE